MSSPILPFPHFTVFISSSQAEFATFRQNLKIAINSERFADQRIMRGVLIEDQSGPIIAEDIESEIEHCSIYVGIFGSQKSDWTFKEYKEARRRGLPLLVYQLAKSKKKGTGRKTKVQEFLDKEVKPFSVRIRKYQSEPSLERAALNDIASEVARLVNEAGSIRRLLHKGIAPP